MAARRVPGEGGVPGRKCPDSAAGLWLPRGCVVDVVSQLPLINSTNSRQRHYTRLGQTLWPVKASDGFDSVPRGKYYTQCWIARPYHRDHHRRLLLQRCADVQITERSPQI